MEIRQRKINDEQRKKADACNSPAELLALAENEGIELTDKQLESIAGGGVWEDEHEYYGVCPHCKEEFPIDLDNKPNRCPYCYFILAW